MKVRELFDRYGWIITAFVLVLVALRAFYGRSEFCGAAEEHCLREWISALSGWATVLVAVPTIVFLQRQISEADRHQQENIEISLMPKFALAHRMRNLVRQQFALVHELRLYARRGDNVGRSPRERQDLGNLTRQIAELLAHPDLNEFNTTIAGEPFFTRMLIERETNNLYDFLVRYEQEAFDRVPGVEVSPPGYGVFVHASLESLVAYLETYLRDRDDKARDFLQRWNQPVAGPSEFHEQI